MTVFVKICGIKTICVLDAAVEAGTDAVGFVVGVPSSPRNITLEKAKELVSKVPSRIKSVLVMAPNTQSEVNEVVEYVQPDMVQVHGLDSIEASTPLILGVSNRATLDEARANSNKCDMLLLDSFKEGVHGGTGILQDLSYSQSFIQKLSPFPVILAGGLSPSTVADAIRVTQPFGVDVSSGVERSPGEKAPDLIRAFIEAAKEETQ